MKFQKNDIIKLYFIIPVFVATLLILTVIPVPGLADTSQSSPNTATSDPANGTTNSATDGTINGTTNGTTIDAPGASYKIGVLAFRGEEKALKRWIPTAEYLNQQLHDSTFTILPLGLEELRQAVASRQVDFILTNTGHYVELEVFYGISRIATVKNDIDGQISTSFGAVIFTRADRHDIQSLADLKGKRFMGVKRTGFGGFQMAWRELKDNGIDPFRDFESLEFSGFPQDDVAYAVRDGLVDGGTFRSETLEMMAREGKINLQEFKILNPQFNPNYKMLHSTRLYPVWPFARLKHTAPGCILYGLLLG